MAVAALPASGEPDEPAEPGVVPGPGSLDVGAVEPPPGEGACEMVVVPLAFTVIVPVISEPWTVQ